MLNSSEKMSPHNYKSIMKNLKYIFLLAVLASAGCKKSYEDLQINPNQPATAPPSLIFQGILNDMFDDCWNSNIVMRYSQFHLCNYNYYGNN
jgi:hypothetical protein